MDIHLVIMTRDMMHTYFKSFAYDPLTIPDKDNTPIYLYDQENVDQLYDKHLSQNKIHFAIMHDGQIIGDIYLKHINPAAQTCEMGIHMANDNYKGKGYGTLAERILLQYAFAKLNIKTVYADALIKNTRSMHVLKKVGFTEISRNVQTARFECQKSTWDHTACLDNSIIA